jgi:hypothetical protein
LGGKGTDERAGSCKPCVKELWKEERRCWREVHPGGPDIDPEMVEEAPGEKRKDGTPEVEIKIER